MCVFVREREREMEHKKGDNPREQQQEERRFEERLHEGRQPKRDFKKRENHSVCVCVCERERGREERKCGN